jgi:hypothetical protein
MGNKERRGGVKGGDTTTLKGDPSRLGSHTAIIEQLILHADQVCAKKSRVSPAVLRIRDVYPGFEFFHPGSRVNKFDILDPDQRI